jgi:hypothetical protein
LHIVFDRQGQDGRRRYARLTIQRGGDAAPLFRLVANNAFGTDSGKMLRIRRIANSI